VLEAALLSRIHLESASFAGPKPCCDEELEGTGGEGLEAAEGGAQEIRAIQPPGDRWGQLVHRPCRRRGGFRANGFGRRQLDGEGRKGV
jgi:hypothetical protein